MTAIVQRQRRRLPLFMWLAVLLVLGGNRSGPCSTSVEATLPTTKKQQQQGQRSNDDDSSGVVDWKQRLEQTAHPLWLRERCLEPFYADPATRQPHYNLHQEVADLSVRKLEYLHSSDAGSNESAGNDSLVVVAHFSDGTSCSYEAERLRAELNGDDGEHEFSFVQTKEWYVVPQLPWNASSLVAPSQFAHDDLLIDGSDDFRKRDTVRKFLSTVLSTGIAVVSDVPRRDGQCAAFGRRFSTLRQTEWGPVFNVRSQADETASDHVQRRDLAYTSRAIGMHVDNPYRVDAPPAYQLLHALEHCDGRRRRAVSGECQVHSTFVDGFAVAQKLCRGNRSYFDILTEVPLRFENNGGDDNSFLYRYAPMIELAPKHEYNQRSKNNGSGNNECPAVAAINFSAKSGGYAPHIPDVATADLFYSAKREFSRLLHDPEMTVAVQLWPGALVMFDNRRILHSRSQITAETDGPRWLQGCYVDRDGIHYLYERLRRQIAHPTHFRNLADATRDDFDRMGVEYDRHVARETLHHLVELLEQQRGAYLGAPVSLYEHNVQTASRALRGGAGDEIVTVSLFHDVFETLAVKNHGELAAALLAPWISPASQWMLAHHEVFQGYYYFGKYEGGNANLRDMFRHSDYYNQTVQWCQDYDQASFDPDYPSLPLEALLPAAERVLAKPQYWWNPQHPKAGAVSAPDEAENGSSSSTTTTTTTTNITSKAEGDDSTTRENAPPPCRDTWTCY